MKYTSIKINYMHIIHINRPDRRKIDFTLFKTNVSVSLLCNY